MLERINDLPVKKVNGTIIFVRDVAYVHEGSPPQTNLVRVNGARAVLMTILKAGSASTLDIIAGVKTLLPRIEESLPAGLDLNAVGDQSVFVKAAVIGVMREAALAAASGRRDDPAVPRQLALDGHHPHRDPARHPVLADRALLARRDHQRHDLGRPRARGRHPGRRRHRHHREHQLSIWNRARRSRPAILDGAQQIVIPAFVTLLCLCIVFVPMFQLGGVAGYLFRPMAEAVVFALIGSFILSRTLVPTMANYLMRGAHGRSRSEAHTLAPAPRSRNPFKRFQQGFEERFERVRERYRSLLVARAWNGRRCSSIGFLALRAAVLRARARFSARTSFPRWIRGRS